MRKARKRCVFGLLQLHHAVGNILDHVIGEHLGHDLFKHKFFGKFLFDRRSVAAFAVLDVAAFVIIMHHTVLGDGSHIIYVNASIDDKDTPLSKLMHDFKCKNADDMYYPQLASRVNTIKNTEGGRENMCKIMEDLNEKAVRDNRIQIAQTIIETGKLSYEEIAQCSGLTLEEIKALAEGKPA